MDAWNPIIAANDDEEEETFREVAQEPSRLMLAAIILGFVLALGFVGHVDSESVSVMQEIADRQRAEPCPKFNADAERLVASMVQPSYIKGAAQPHECHYRSER